MALQRPAAQGHRRRLAWAVALAVFVIGGFGIASDGLGFGSVAGPDDRSRAYFALRYLDPRQYEPASATADIQECVAANDGSRIDASTPDLVPLRTLSVDLEDRHSFETCIKRIGNVRVTGPETSSAPLAAEERFYSVHYSNIWEYDAKPLSAALAKCMTSSGASHESTAFRIPPIPTVNLTGLPGEHTAFADCLGRMPDVRVETA